MTVELTFEKFHVQPIDPRRSVLHYVAVCVAVCCGVLQCVAVCCSVLQCHTHFTSGIDTHMQPTNFLLWEHWQLFSKISSRYILPYNISTELTFEKFSEGGKRSAGDQGQKLSKVSFIFNLTYQMLYENRADCWDFVPDFSKWEISQKSALYLCYMVLLCCYVMLYGKMYRELIFENNCQCSHSRKFVGCIWVSMPLVKRVWNMVLLCCMIKCIES